MVCCLHRFVLPILKIAIMFIMVHMKFSWQQGKSIHLWKTLVSAWCGTEVFLLSVLVIKIDVGSVARAMVSNICGFVTDILRDHLLPIGLVTEQDVHNSCFCK